MLSDTIYITVPVTTVTITPSGDNNVECSVEGESQTFTCTTDSSRPAVWIQWYNYHYMCIYITVPVTTVTITTSGDNNVEYIVEGEARTFTCTTDSSRPAAWVQWHNY